MKRFLLSLVLVFSLVVPAGAGWYIDDGADLYLRTRGYLMRDEFTTNRAAGSVNGTLSEYSGHTRTVTDTESKLSITGGALTFSGGKAVPAWGDPGIWYPDVTRVAGKMLLMKFNTGTASATNGILFGFGRATTGEAKAEAFYSVNNIVYASTNIGSTTVNLGALANSTDYRAGILLRTNGAFYFKKGGNNYELEWVSALGTTATLYPLVNNKGFTGLTFDYLRIPSQLWLPSPICSASFAGADATVLTALPTDGSGHSEVTGIGSGGSGLTWTANAGTWTISSNKAVCSELGVGGFGIATVNVSTANVIHTVAITRAGGNVGLVVRYTDSDNYIYAYHDGTNAVLVKKVTGSDTTKISGASAYSAGAELRVVVDGSYLALYYNQALIGSVSDASIPTGTRVGLYSSHTGNTLDNSVTYPRGSEGQFSILNRF
jgi:hypothetical protein